MSAANLPSELYSDTRQLIGESSAGFWADDLLMRRLHSAQQDVVRVITEENPTFFTATYDISLVADQEVYSLPLPARRGTRWIAAENRINGEPYYYVWDIDLRRRLYGESANVPSSNQGDVQITWDGDQIRVVPVPDTATSNAIRLVYEPQYGNMVQMTVVGTPGATAATMTSAAPDYSSSYGVLDRRDDYYNGMDVYVVDGAGIGETRRVTDYDGSARAFTFDSAWAATPTAGDTLALVSPVPEDWRDLVALRAAHGLVRSGDGARWRRLGDDWKDRLWDLRAWCAERSEFRAQAAEPMGGGY